MTTKLQIHNQTNILQLANLFGKENLILQVPSITLNDDLLLKLCSARVLLSKNNNMESIAWYGRTALFI